MAISPEVNSGSVAVVTDELAVNNGDRRKAKVVGTRAQKRGADRQKRDVNGPGVFEGGMDGEEERETDKSVVSVGTPIEGSDQLGNQGLERLVEFLGKDEKEEVIGEERHHGGVDVENASEDGEAFDDRTGRPDPSHSFLVGAFEAISKCHFAAYHDTQVRGRPAEWEIGPRTVEKLCAQEVICGAGGRRDNAALVLVYTEARDD